VGRCLRSCLVPSLLVSARRQEGSRAPPAHAEASCTPIDRDASNIRTLGDRAKRPRSRRPQSKESRRPSSWLPTCIGRFTACLDDALERMRGYEIEGRETEPLQRSIRSPRHGSPDFAHERHDSGKAFPKNLGSRIGATTGRVDRCRMSDLNEALPSPLRRNPQVNPQTIARVTGVLFVITFVTAIPADLCSRRRKRGVEHLMTA
jgi:hypothetical protein